MSTATFLKYDTNTSGAWIGKYGSNGYQKMGSELGGNNQEISLPSYVSSLTFNNIYLYNWTGSGPFSTHPQALQNAGNPADCDAACYYNFSTWSFTVNVNDTKTHQIAVYALDYDDNGGRSQTFNIIDPSTGNEIDSRSISTYQLGIWSIWKFSGNIQINVVSTGDANGVVSGIFFDSAGLTDLACTAIDGTSITDYAF